MVILFLISNYFGGIFWPLEVGKEKGELYQSRPLVGCASRIGRWDGERRENLTWPLHRDCWDGRWATWKMVSGFKRRIGVWRKRAGMAAASWVGDFINCGYAGLGWSFLFFSGVRSFSLKEKWKARSLMIPRLGRSGYKISAKELLHSKRFIVFMGPTGISTVFIERKIQKI